MDYRCYINVRNFFPILTLLILLIGINIASGISSNESEEIRPTYYNHEKDFHITIVNVFQASLEKPDVKAEFIDGIPIYDVVSEFDFTLITISYNFTGYTQWEMKNVSLPVYEEYPLSQDSFTPGNITLIGQMFIIVNGEVRALKGSQFTKDHSEVVTSLPQGDSIITLLYLGRDEEKGYQMYDTTLIIRLRTEDNFREYRTEKIELDTSYVDTYVKGELHGEVIVQRYYAYAYDKVEIFRPTLDFGIDSNGTDLKTIESIHISNITKFDFDIETNTTGFEQHQIQSYWNSTQGFSFIYDSSGLQDIDSTEIVVREGTNHIGVVTFAPYGIWTMNTPCQVFCYEPEPDFEGLFTGSAINGSFDFVSNQDIATFTLTFDTITISTTEEAPFYGLHNFLLIVVISIKRRMKYE